MRIKQEMSSRVLEVVDLDAVRYDHLNLESYASNENDDEGKEN
jgi:hypothetical protein